MGGKGGGGGGGFDPSTRFDMKERPGYAIDMVTGDVYQGAAPGGGMNLVGNKKDYFIEIDKKTAADAEAAKAAKEQEAADKAAAKVAADQAAADKVAADKAAADKVAADKEAADKLAHTPLGPAITTGGGITQPTDAGNAAGGTGTGTAGAGDVLGGAVLDPPKYWVGGVDSFKPPPTRKSSLKTTL